MSCDNCRSCMEKNYYANNFLPDKNIFITNDYAFPSSFPKKERKNLKIFYYDSSKEEVFVEALHQQGGSYKEVDGKEVCGFWVSREYVVLKEQHIPNDSRVKIIDPDGDYSFNTDLKEQNSFLVLKYQNDSSHSEFGNYFLAMDEEDDEYDGEAGAWVPPSYLEVIKTDKKETQTRNNFQERNGVDMNPAPQVTGMISGSTADSLQTYFKKAGTRSASRTAIKAVRKALLQILKRHYDSQTSDQKAVSSNLKVVQNLLDTDIGQAALGILTGYLLTKIPVLNQKPDVLDVAEEMTIEGMSVGMDQVINFGIENVLPEILPLLDSFPGTEDLKNLVSSLPVVGTKKSTKTTEKQTPKTTAKSAPKSKVEPEVEIEEVVVTSSGNTTTRKKKK